MVSANIYSKSLEYKGICDSKNQINKFGACLDTELKKYDQDLNNLYKKFFKRSHHEKLKKIETTWIKYKEEDCDYIAMEVHESVPY